MGRQKMKRYLESQQAMAASAMVTFNRANRWAFSTRERPLFAEIWAAMRFQVSDVLLCQKRASSDWSALRGEPEKAPMVLVSLRSAANCGLFKAYGGGRRNCEGRNRTHGVMVANCGPAPEALSGGVGRQKPTAAGVPTIPSTPSNGGGVGKFPSVDLHAQIASATV